MRWTATVDYQTKAGNPGSWRGEIDAPTEAEADALGLKKAKIQRPYIGKVYGGSTEQTKEP